MGKDIRKLAEKYFRGECSPEETKCVLALFDTPEGKNYLENRLDRDLSQITEAPDPGIYDKVPTSRIKSRLDRARKRETNKIGSAKPIKKYSRYSTKNRRASRRERRTNV